MTARNHTLRCLASAALRAAAALLIAAALIPVASLAPAHASQEELVASLQHYVRQNEAAHRDAAQSANPASTLNHYLQDSLNADASTGADKPLRSSASLPQRYFLTNEGSVTGVKFQNPWGSCWSFAHLASIESAILKKSGTHANGEADSPKLNDLPTSPDLSEHAFAWYARSAQTKVSAGSQAGEGTSATQSRIGANQLTGAPVMLPITLLTNQQALTTEDRVPYTYKNADGSFHLNDSSWWRPFPGPDGSLIQPTDRDWSLDDDISRSFTDSGWQVKNAIMLPSPALIFGDPDTGVSYAYNPDSTQAIKEALMQNGAVNIMYAADMSMPAQTTDAAAATDRRGVGEYINYGERSEVWCQYNNSLAPLVDHAVTIVGWDDEYSRDNFKGSAEGWEAPPGDGAWLVKNSWGADDFFDSAYHGTDNVNEWGLPYDGEGTHSGFFWLSYYDHSIDTPVSYEVERVDEGQDNLHQYDYLGSAVLAMGPSSMPASTPVKVANVFTAEKGEYLEAVSLQTAIQNAEAHIWIYRMGADAKIPADGVLVAEKSVTPAYGGTYKVELDEPVRLAQGERFAVAQQVDGAILSLDDGTEVRMRYINLEMSTAESAESLQIASKVVYDEGQTFVEPGDGWISVAELNEAIGNSPSTNEFGNALIKAYTDDDPNPIAQRTIVDEESGVSLAGLIEQDASTRVVPYTYHDAEGHEGCDAIRKASDAGHVLSLHDISLQGAWTGGLTVSIPVAGRDGDTLTVMHCKDGELELIEAQVKDGAIAITTSALSPFAVLDDTYTREAILAMGPPSPGPDPDDAQGTSQSAGKNMGDVPRTGVIVSMTAFVLAAIALLASVVLFLVRKRGNGAHGLHAKR